MPASPHLALVADVGATTSRHVGDEAMLLANLDALARHLPGARFTVVSARPWETAPPGIATLEGLDFPGLGEAPEDESERRLAAVLDLADARAAPTSPQAAAVARISDTLATTDALLFSGAGNLRSRWPDLLYERLALAGLAARLGKPVAFLGQTLGPELTVRQRERLAATLRRAAWVGVRDLESAALALDLGVPAARLDHQLDDAFLLAAHPPSAATLQALAEPGEAPWIALTLHPFAAADDAAVAALAGQLAAVAAATAARLVLVPHEERDRRFAEALRARTAALGSMVVAPVLAAREARWLTGRAAVVISTRYHPVVFALAAGAPCLALADGEYGRVKALGALRQAGQEAWCLPLREACRGGLLPGALELWRRRDEIRADLLAQLPACEAREAGRWRRLLAALGLAPAGHGEPGAPAADSDLLLGHPPRALALTLAAALAQDRSAASAELSQLHAEREWIVSTRVWQLRTLVLRLRPLAALYRWITRPAGRTGPVPPRSRRLR